MNAKARILVIDDEEIVRLSYMRTLASEHCNVQVVTNGYDAIALMETQAFDVVLLDMSMPGMDGMSVLKVIKQRWPECEVVIITGYPGVESAKQAVSLGAFDYLSKPAGPDDVINAANGAMTHKRWALRCEQSAPVATVH
jgi:DNA-binding NtrC family response regulator